MSSVEIYIVVEGASEQAFIREVLGPEMAAKGILIHNPPIIGKSGSKGGNVSFERAKQDIGNHLKQRSHTYVTTMFDLYGIDQGWPGINKLKRLISTGKVINSARKAEIIEAETKKEIVKAFPCCDAERRFIPYIQMHELEALLFSDSEILADKTGINLSLIQDIRSQFNNPEEINENPNSNPAKRLDNLSKECLNRGYRKVVMAVSVGNDTGIRIIRESCPHFNDWLRQLEQLVE